MYTTKGYIDTFTMWLNLDPFVISGTYEHVHEWK
jgi:hypothetical protein